MRDYERPPRVYRPLTSGDALRIEIDVKTGAVFSPKQIASQWDIEYAKACQMYHRHRYRATARDVL